MNETYVTDWGMTQFYITFTLVREEIEHRNEVKDEWNICHWLRNDTVLYHFHTSKRGNWSQKPDKRWFKHLSLIEGWHSFISLSL